MPLIKRFLEYPQQTLGIDPARTFAVHILGNVFAR